MHMYYSNWKHDAIYKGATQDKQVSLTFDDGPHAKNAFIILDILDAHNIQGTFFWIVSHAIKFNKQNPALFQLLLKRIKDKGHTIGFHAPNNYFPTPATFLFGKFNREEFNNGLINLEKLTGVKIKFYRPHRFQYGASIVYARENKLQTIIGMFPSTFLPSREQVRGFSKAKPGDILILHEKNNIGYILPRVIKNLTKKGFTFSALPQFITKNNY